MTQSADPRGVTTIPLRGLRAMIADKMVSSLTQAAQLTHHARCNISGLLARKQALAGEGIKVSVEDLFIEAVTKTLGQHPDLNGTIQGKDISLHTSVNLSIAMAMPGNLLVAPAVFDAQDLTLGQLSAARRDLAERAKINKLTVTEMTGGTFTVSNLGLSRVHHFTPILNAPQIGILGIGCVETTLGQDAKGDIHTVPMAGLSLTFDHRAVDGAPAAQFLTDLCACIEQDHASDKK